MRKLSVLCLALLLVCSCAWAFPFSKASSGKSGAESSEAPQESSEELWDKVQSQISSETEQSGTSEALSNLLEDLQSNSRLTKSQLSELISKLEELQSDIEIVNADSRAKDEQIAALAKKANGFHFFVNGGAVLGFKDAKPTIGAVANVGVKFGGGWTAGTGVQYQVLSFDSENKFDLSWNIDKLSITATIGYEF